MMAEALQRVADGLAAPGQPGVAFTALDQALASTVGHCLFTVLVLDEVRGVSRRFYSSNPDAYPVSGEKPIRRTSEFYCQVILQGLPRICHDRADIERAFPDHALISSLGCEGAINVPVRWNGKTLGALNLLDRAGHYTTAQIPTLGVFAALAVAPVLHVLGNMPPGPSIPAP